MRERWPGWVYGSGMDPDYRFSFANERMRWARAERAMRHDGPLPSSVLSVILTAAVAVAAVVVLGVWSLDP